MDGLKELLRVNKLENAINNMKQFKITCWDETRVGIIWQNRADLVFKCF